MRACAGFDPEMSVEQSTGGAPPDSHGDRLLKLGFENRSVQPSEVPGYAILDASPGWRTF